MAISSSSVGDESQVSEDPQGFMVQEAPWGGNTWHHYSTGSVSRGSTFAGITIRKPVELSKEEEKKKKQTLGEEYLKTKGKSKTPRFKVKAEKQSLEEAPEVTSRLRKPSSFNFSLKDMFSLILEREDGVGVETEKEKH